MGHRLGLDRNSALAGRSTGIAQTETQREVRETGGGEEGIEREQSIKKL